MNFVSIVHFEKVFLNFFLYLIRIKLLESILEMQGILIYSREARGAGSISPDLSDSFDLMC